MDKAYVYTRGISSAAECLERRLLVQPGGRTLLDGAAPGNSAASGFGDVHRAVSTNYECVRIWSVRVLFVRMWIDVVERVARSMRLCNAPDDSPGALCAGAPRPRCPPVSSSASSSTPACLLQAPARVPRVQIDSGREWSRTAAFALRYGGTSSSARFIVDVAHGSVKPTRSSAAVGACRSRSRLRLSLSLSPASCRRPCPS